MINMNFPILWAYDRDTNNLGKTIFVSFELFKKNNHTKYNVDTWTSKISQKMW
jgi:hypothetical protein